MIPLADDDGPTPEDEAKHADAVAADAHYADLIDQSEQVVLTALQERDDAIAELVAAKAELDLMRASRDALARYIELIPDPMHQPSRPRSRPRFAGEDHDDYALRGE